MKNFLIVLVLAAPYLLFSQNERFIGLLDRQLVEINPYTAELNVIKDIDIPDQSQGSDMAYDKGACLFYTTINITDDPRLISFDFNGNVIDVGQYFGNGFTVSTIEAIAYNQVDEKLYASASVNGDDFSAETLVTVNPITAECEIVTTLDFLNGRDPDIDNMVFDGNILYFNDGQPNFNITDFYSLDISQASATTSINQYFRTDYAASSDIIYFQEDLYYPALDFRLLTHDPVTNVELNLGRTHNTGEFNSRRIIGFEYIDDYTSFDYSQNLGADITICDGDLVLLEAINNGQEIEWSNGSTTSTVEITEAGNYFFSAIVNGCIIFTSETVVIEVAESSESQITENICSGESVTINGESYSQPGNYIQNLNTTDGCDSIINIELIVNETFTTSIEIDICAGDSYNFFGNLLESPGEYTEIIESMVGCDSSVVLQLSVLESMTRNESYTFCLDDGIELYNEFYTDSGTYNLEYTDNNGCVGELTLELSGENCSSCGSSINLSASSITITKSKKDLYEVSVSKGKELLYEELVSSEDLYEIIKYYGSIYLYNDLTVNQLPAYLSNYNQYKGIPEISKTTEEIKAASFFAKTIMNQTEHLQVGGTLSHR